MGGPNTEMASWGHRMGRYRQQRVVCVCYSEKNPSDPRGAGHHLVLTQQDTFVGETGYVGCSQVTLPGIEPDESNHLGDRYLHSLKGSGRASRSL